MPQTDNSDITLGELGRRMDTFQVQVASSIQVLTDKLDDRPSHKDLSEVKETLRREIAVETAARTVSETNNAKALTAIQDGTRYAARTAVSAVITTVVTVVAAVIVFFVTKV